MACGRHAFCFVSVAAYDAGTYGMHAASRFPFCFRRRVDVCGVHLSRFPFRFVTEYDVLRRRRAAVAISPFFFSRRGRRVRQWRAAVAPSLLSVSVAAC